jgi:penicillin amidase
MRETLNENISLKWTFFLPENSTMLAFYKMARAQNVSEFASAVELGTSPGMNILYADTENNIGLWHFGKIPRMSDNRERDRFLDGATGAHEYLGYDDFKQIPYQLNPDSGVIVSANWRPSDDFLKKKILGDWMPRDRATTISNRLALKKVWDIESSKALQTLPENDFYPQIIDFLKKEIPEIGEKFKKWNFQSQIDSKEAYVFHRFLGLLGLEWFKSQVNNQEIAEKICANASSWDSFREALLTKKISHQLIKKSWDEVGLFEKENKVWGDWHHLTLEHPLGKIPLFTFFNVGNVGVMGGHDQINQLREENWCLSGKVKSGPSLRFLVDLADSKRSWGILPSGNSGHIRSPFYKNQWADFVAGNYLEDHFYQESDWGKDETTLLQFAPSDK